MLELSDEQGIGVDNWYATFLKMDVWSCRLTFEELPPPVPLPPLAHEPGLFGDVPKTQ